MAADAQDISSHDIGYVEYVDPGLTWGRILSTCVISIWSNDVKHKYMFMFPLKTLARKGLSHNMSPSFSNGYCFAQQRIWELWTSCVVQAMIYRNKANWHR